MKLKIISKQKGKFIDCDIEFVKAFNSNVEIIILKNHAPMLTVISSERPFAYKIPNENNLKEINLYNAFLEVSRENNKTLVTVLAD